MANSNEEQKKEAQSIKQTQTKEPEKPIQKNKNPARYHTSLLNVLFVCIAIAAIIIAIWSIQNSYNLQNKLAIKQTDLLDEMDQIKQNQMDSQKQTEAKTNSMKQSQNALQSKLDDLNKQLQVAMNQRFYQNQDWLLFKVRYYLELAQIN